jgi:predicted Fe-Mo cluster-binding NifX family protein
MIVDLDDMSFEAIPNTNLAQGSGVGIQSAKLVVDQGAKAVLTGNIGPKAQDVLAEMGVDIITGISGTVREKAQQYKDGELQQNDQPNAQIAPGLQADANQSRRPRAQQTPNAGPGMGRGMGMGGGCGKGGGRGMGMGRGMGRALSAPTAMTSLGEMTGKDELAGLKQDARTLREEMQAIERRIKELENENP